MIADIRNRFNELSRSKKLPKNLDMAKPESAKNRFDEVRKVWDEGSQAFKKGRLADVLRRAAGVPDRIGLGGKEVRHLSFSDTPS